LGGGISGGVTGLGQGVPAAGEVAGQFEKVGGLGGFLSRGGLTSAIGRGIATNALTQGIGVATGLQSKFDFAGVAAAGIGAGAADFAGARTAAWGSFGSDLATGTASALANAATRSAVSGNSFGDNLIAALPDAIGGALGRAGARGAAALADTLAREAAASPANETAGKSANVGEDVAPEIVVTGGLVRGALRDSFWVNLPASRAPAVLLEATGGQGIEGFANSILQAAGETSQYMANDPLRAHGTYLGGDVPTVGASPIAFFKSLIGRDPDVLRGLGFSYASDTLFKDAIHDPTRQREIGMRFGAFTVADGDGRFPNGAIDPKGLEAAYNTLRGWSTIPGFESGFGAATEVVRARLDQLSAEANRIVDQGVIGTFVRTGSEFASEAVSLLFLAKDFATGDASLKDVGAAVTAGGVLAGGAYVLSRGRIKPVIAAERAIPLSSLGAKVNRAFEFGPKQLQSKFKHAADFGVDGPYNGANAAKFEAALQRHVSAETTNVIPGTYRGRDVTHFVDPQNGLNVMRGAGGISYRVGVLRQISLETSLNGAKCSRR